MLPNASVTFPSGAEFRIVTTPVDGIDYSDPVAGGIVPLIEVEGRLEESLSPNFRVKEFAARKLDDKDEKVRYARISPTLVTVLQQIRERVDAPVIVNSGYRYPALNEAVDGADQSQHMTGRAADFRSPAKTPLELAQIALEEAGCEIGLGLGENYIHLDLRGERATWTYPGASLSATEFRQWVQRICSSRAE